MTQSDNNHPEVEEIRLESPGYLSFSRRVILGMSGTAITGGVGAALAASLYTNGAQRLMLGYLVAVAFVLSISLGSLFFILVQHLTRAGWAVLIRRPAEVFALNIVTVALLAIPIAINAFSGSESIYPWARGNSATAGRASDLTQVTFSQIGGHGEPAEPHSRLYAHQSFDALTASRTAWLNPTFFTIRLIVYFAVWTGIAWFYFSSSRRQDEVGGTADTFRMERYSPPFTLAFAITLTFAAFDLLMSLNPHWYSTIFGVYYFAGSAVGGFATSLLVWLLLSRIGKMPARLSEAHFRDLGRLLFAFVFFWGYIAFSQYMLLWYANIPETTGWWVVRGASTADGYGSSWGYVLLLLLFGHFIIPFLGLMSRHVKDHKTAMLGWAIFLLAMHYVDIYWLVMPECRPSIAFGLPEIGSMMLVGGLYCVGASYFATQTALVPTGDPRIAYSAALKDVY